MDKRHSANKYWRNEAIRHTTVPIPIKGDVRAIENRIHNRSSSYESFEDLIGNPDKPGLYFDDTNSQCDIFAISLTPKNRSAISLEDKFELLMRGKCSDDEGPHNCQAELTSKRMETGHDSESEDEEKMLMKLLKEVLIGQEKICGMLEKAALQQMEVQTVQLQMLQKMSDVIEKKVVEKKVQLITDLHNTN